MLGGIYEYYYLIFYAMLNLTEWKMKKDNCN